MGFSSYFHLLTHWSTVFQQGKVKTFFLLSFHGDLKSQSSLCPGARYVLELIKAPSTTVRPCVELWADGAVDNRDVFNLLNWCAAASTGGVFLERSAEGKYKMNFSQADAACRQQGATLASFKQIGDAQQVNTLSTWSVSAAGGASPTPRNPSEPPWSLSETFFSDADSYASQHIVYFLFFIISLIGQNSL